jgi:hypothetical protein
LACREDLVLHDLLAAPALFRVLRQEYKADSVLAGLRQAQIEGLALLLEEGVRHLNQEPSAISRERVAAAGSAVHQVQKQLDPVPHDRMRRAAVQCRYESNTTGVVFVARVVEARGRRQTHVALVLLE